MADIAPLLRKISPAGPNLLVIRTAIGAAQRVALALDRSDWPEMVGNIGGDDTVFVATESALRTKTTDRQDRAIRSNLTSRRRTNDELRTSPRSFSRFPAGWTRRFACRG